MTTKRHIYWLCGVLVCGWLGLAARAQTTETVNRNYRILPGDELSSTVKDLADFDWTGEVDGAGRIELPFLTQPVTAVCRTADEVAQELTQRYQRIVRQPQVSVTVLGSVAQREPPLILNGAVKQAGRFLLHRPTRLSEILAKAGGVMAPANATVRVFSTFNVFRCDEKGTLQRHAANNMSPAVYNLSEVLRGAPETDPQVYAGDVVTVLERDLVYLNGGVIAPQPVDFVPELTLLRALTQVGGVISGGDAQRIRLLRRKAGQAASTELLIDGLAIKNGLKPDIPLQANDVIIVPCAICGGRSDYCHTCTDIGGRQLPPDVKNLPLKVIE